MPRYTPEQEATPDSKIAVAASNKFNSAKAKRWLYVPELDHLDRPLNKPTFSMLVLTSLAVEVSKLADDEMLVSLIQLNQGGFKTEDYIEEDAQDYLPPDYVSKVVVRATKAGQPQLEYHGYDNYIYALPLSAVGEEIVLDAVANGVLQPPIPTEPPFTGQAWQLKPAKAILLTLNWHFHCESANMS